MRRGGDDHRLLELNSRENQMPRNTKSRKVTMAEMIVARGDPRPTGVKLKRSSHILIGVCYSFGLDQLLKRPSFSKQLKTSASTKSSTDMVTCGSTGRPIGPLLRVAELQKQIITHSIPLKHPIIEGIKAKQTPRSKRSAPHQSLRRLVSVQRLVASSDASILESNSTRLLEMDIALIDLTEYCSKSRGGLDKLRSNQNVLVELGLLLGANAILAKFRRPPVRTFLVVNERAAKAVPSSLGGVVIHRYRVVQDADPISKQHHRVRVAFPKKLQMELRGAICQSLHALKRSKR